jgi:hypothetical protein
MTKNQINELIAEHVMNWDKSDMFDINDYRSDGTPVLLPNFPDYTDSMEHAWEVVETIYGAWDIKSRSKGWQVRLSVPMGTSEKIVYTSEDTAPHAICLAAIKSLDLI